jgi:hypothetical protein
MVTSAAAPDWEVQFRSRLPLYGHRNWIVVADSAYPAQSRPGIETVVSSADQVHVLQEVLAIIAASPHVKANVYTDEELGFVPEQDAPGITECRLQLTELLRGKCAHQLRHQEIILKLDQAAQTFRVLIIKTNTTIPYTSVFLELDCAYWSTAAEQRLRSAMLNPPAK